MYVESAWIQQAGDADRIAVGPSNELWTLNAYGQPVQLTAIQERAHLKLATQSTVLNAAQYLAYNPIKRDDKFSGVPTTSPHTCMSTTNTSND
jgi:hypothetical protein